MRNPFNEVDNYRDENDDSAYGPLPIAVVLAPVGALFYGLLYVVFRALT